MTSQPAKNRPVLEHRTASDKIHPEEDTISFTTILYHLLEQPASVISAGCYFYTLFKEETDHENEKPQRIWGDCRPWEEPPPPDCRKGAEWREADGGLPGNPPVQIPWIF